MRSLKRAFRKEAAKPLKKALEEYELHMRDDLKNKPGSVATTTARLGLFFQGFDGSLEDLDEAECTRRYEALRFHRTPRGTRIADDTQLNTLAQVRTFLGWCLKMKWLPANPAANVEGKGRHKHGKPQLRIDEAKRWLDEALRLASKAEIEREREGALKAMMTLCMGMRECEVLRREVRDVDDGGRLLWIPNTKTDAGRRTLEVPEFLRPLLVAQAKGRPGTDPLFRHRCKGVGRKWVKRICRRARVMEVGAQSMRGLHATLAVDAGITGHAVAAALGHPVHHDHPELRQTGGGGGGQAAAHVRGPEGRHRGGERVRGKVRRRPGAAQLCAQLFGIFLRSGEPCVRQVTVIPSLFVELMGIEPTASRVRF